MFDSFNWGLTILLAYKASSYLDELIKLGLVDSEANADLDRIYEEHAPFNGLSLDKNSESDKPVLLNREAVPRIVTLFDLPSSAEADLLRALDQTELRLSRGHSSS